MKRLHNISQFCSTSDIKPGIACVYIKKDETLKTIETVATDSYRLASIKYKLEDYPELDILLPGLYEARAFKELCSKLNKVLIKLPEKLEAVKIFSRFKTPLHISEFPEYETLFKQIDRVTEYQEGIRGKFNYKYMVDHIKLCGALEGGNFDQLEFNDMAIKLHGMLEFKTECARVVLMPSQRK